MDRFGRITELVAAVPAGYPYFLAVVREGRFKGQAPMEMRFVPGLRRQWDRGGFGTGTRATELKSESVRDLLGQLRAKGIEPAHDDVEFYVVRAPNAPREGVQYARLLSMARTAARTKNLKVEPTTPGSKNHWKVTYHDGTEKWVDARPGRGEPSRREQRLLQRKMRSPAVQRAINRLDDALGGYKGEQDSAPLEQAVEKNEVGLDRELSKTVNRLFVKTVKKNEGKDIPDVKKEGLDVIKDHVNRHRRDSSRRANVDVDDLVAFVESTEKDWNYVTPEELEGMDRGGLFLLDVRKPEDFKREHIPGATNIFWLDLLNEENLARLPKDKRIVVVCYVGHTASQAMVLLRLLGYDAVALKFGMGISPVKGVPVAGWKDWGFETEGTCMKKVGRCERIAERVAGRVLAMSDDMALRKTREVMFYVDRAIATAELVEQRLRRTEDYAARAVVTRAMNKLYEVSTDLEGV